MHTTITLAGIAALILGGPAYADDKPSLQDQLARLEAEQKAQRQVLQGLIQLLQRQVAAQQTALDALQAAVQAGAAAGPSPAPDRGAPPDPKAIAGGRGAAEPRHDRRPPQPDNVGSVSGSVAIRGASAAWVYVDDIQGAGAGTATMAQRATAFVPGVLVVPKGTKVDFPNGDPVFHNVFSMTTGMAFDLGSYPQGESRTMTMTRTGVVDVYCNLHAQMHGYVFVVPSALFVKVGGDGKFTLGNIPPGNHRIGVWAPGATPVVKDVVVTAGRTATLGLEITASPAATHLRKDGTPYGSYAE